MLIYSLLFILSSNAVSLRRDKSILYARVVITILTSTIVICFNSYFSDFHDKGLGFFGGFYQTSALTHTFHIFLLIITITILILNGFYPRKVYSVNYSSLFNLAWLKLVYFNGFILNKMSEQFRIIEYPLLILFVVIGGTFLISSSDLITLFLSIELQSYGLYILCAVYRNSEQATAGGLTYFLLGGLSSCFILLASGLIYGNSGNTSFDGLYVINNITNVQETNDSYISTSVKTLYDSYYLNFSLVMMSVGFLFKVSAAPFHFWSPDVYDAIPTIVTTFVAVFAKISIFILLLELVHYTTNFYASQGDLDIARELEQDNSLFNYSWTFTLILSSFFSLVIGAVLGLTQIRIKRLLAYSTISHLGFILLALTINSVESIQSFIFYLMQYSLTNLNAFIILLSVGYTLYLYVDKQKTSEKLDETNTAKNENELGKMVDKNNSPIQLISQMKGFFEINPVLSISLAITLFSFVGVPPLAGFFAKQMVLSSALDSGYIFMALVAILTSVISACYYLAVVKQIFFDKSDYVINPTIKRISLKGNVIGFGANNPQIKKVIDINVDNITLSSSLTSVISVLTLIILFFILIPQEWLSMANILALILFNC